MGKLIVIDGIDGSGKATQVELLKQKYISEGKEVETLDFPQYTQNFFGGMVRKYLDGAFGQPTTIDPHLASVLYAADRWESSEQIKQWLVDGKTVILDRYYTANLIHQSTKLSADQLENYSQWLEKMEFDTFKIPRPDTIIFLHVDAQTSYDLIVSRGQGNDGHEQLDHLQKAEASCLYLAQKNNWDLIKCCKDGKILPREEIAEAIWNLVK